ncbi:MAG: hypothetical protein HXX17_10940 [Geobacteraceae bacterium]|nr:hypothetical protein [Geobacteraceae bacterium]
MRLINNKGIALITALMFTLIILTLIMGVLAMVIQGTKGTAAMKVYRNATEAAYGGADITMNDVLPRLFTNVSTSIIRSDYNKINFNSMTIGSSVCVRQKRDYANTGTNWSACGDKSLNAKLSPDMTMKLVGTNSQSFTVYSKIVDTLEGVPYPGSTSSGTGGVASQLMGGGVTELSAGTTMNLAHFIYRVEVASEKTLNPKENSRVSVLYEY